MPAKLETNECDEFFANNNSSNTSDKLVEEFRRKIRISLQDAPSNLDENDGRLGTNTTERVPVPSSEHVAEIVGRQGYKIKALRTSTNTYIRTPVRGEAPVFVVTGRKEGVAQAKEYILASAQHFTQIRANRSEAPSPVVQASTSSSAPGHITVDVRVPNAVVGLVIGPKGSTIKRIQKQTYTFIMTPNREMDPVFRVSGLPANVEMAKLEIQSHIISRTAGRAVTPLTIDSPKFKETPLKTVKETASDKISYTGVTGKSQSALWHFNNERETGGNNSFLHPVETSVENQEQHFFPVPCSQLRRNDIFQMSQVLQDNYYVWSTSPSNSWRPNNNWSTYQNDNQETLSEHMSFWSSSDGIGFEKCNASESGYSCVSSSPECYL